MVKYIYQAVALVFIFAGALFLFGRNMETHMEEKGVTEAITDEDRKSTRLNSSHTRPSRMPSSA